MSIPNFTCPALAFNGERIFVFLFQFAAADATTNKTSYFTHEWIRFNNLISFCPNKLSTQNFVEGTREKRMMLDCISYGPCFIFETCKFFFFSN